MCQEMSRVDISRYKHLIIEGAKERYRSMYGPVAINMKYDLS